MTALTNAGLPGAVWLFVAMAATIAVAGTFLSRTADRLADSTGLGEAMAGVILLAAATSLPDFAATLSAAIDARPELAMSNIMGSMAVNLAMLGVADAVYRKANLEHAAASSSNLMQAALFITLLSLPLIASVGPELSAWGIHPATPLIVLAYLGGLELVRSAERRPMWRPRRTPLTAEDAGASGSEKVPVHRLWLAFAVLTALTAAGGWFAMEAAKGIVAYTGISEGVAGALLTGVSTSLPELATTIAAVRQGALMLAVGNILGTNFFNVLVIAGADVGFRNGSIYHALSDLQLAWGLLVILMTGVLLLGMLRRETYGIGRIGFESVLILALYGGGVLMVLLW